MLQKTGEKCVMRRRIEMFLLRIYNVLDLFESALDSCWIQMVLVIGMLPEIETKRANWMLHNA